MAFALLHRLRDRSPHSAPAPLPRGAGALDLTVHDPVGLPMAGAEVSVRGPQGPELMRGQTDPNGIFSATLPPGDHQVLVALDGFRPERFQAPVTAGQRTAPRPLALAPAPVPPTPAPGDWRIDPDHSFVRFTARHIGLAEIHGRFNRFEGSLWIAPDMQDSRVEVTIDAASIDSGVKMRDDHLRSAEFLDVERYPYLQFTGERFVHKGGSRWQVQGVLHLHGVSRSVQLDTRYLGIGTGMGGETRTACTATTELHREDFTLDWRKMLARGIAAIGATIRIELDIQAVQR
ncbi:YceI family protein [Streptomyces sp. MST-110588]|uniref:YceI family protein n=1 Tax=Streptomyces sp. MST-110588 TaxID=2833628 RepID=UPI001F5C9577|nr:YceI family protein [Streptomyces sp. MST-110588]UNO43259.1 YceI family protein [Streptomyces sp. MST-110588]